MAPDPRLVALVDGYAASRARLEARVTELVIAELSRFGGWYSPRQVETLTAAIAARVTAGQLGTAQLTDAYLARVTSYVTARTTVGATVPSVMGKTLRVGVTNHEEVYARVAAEFRMHRSRGRTTGDSLALAMVRAQEMVATDMGLASQHQTRRFTRRHQIARYRRVVRPELSKDGSCGLCVAASDRIYWRGDLLPIHARCKCVVIPVTEKTDPGTQLNDDTLDALYGEAGSTGRDDLKRVRVKVVEHGELGPQLRLERHGFRGPGDVVTPAA